MISMRVITYKRKIASNNRFNFFHSHFRWPKHYETLSKAFALALKGVRTTQRRDSLKEIIMHKENVPLIVKIST